MGQLIRSDVPCQPGTWTSCQRAQYALTLRVWSVDGRSVARPVRRGPTEVRRLGARHRRRVLPDAREADARWANGAAAGTAAATSHLTGLGQSEIINASRRGPGPRWSNARGSEGGLIGLAGDTVGTRTASHASCVKSPLTTNACPIANVPSTRSSSEPYARWWGFGLVRPPPPYRLVKVSEPQAARDLGLSCLFIPAATLQPLWVI